MDDVLALRAGTEDSIDDMMRFFQRSLEVFGEWHVQVFQLLGQSLVKIVSAAFRVVDCGAVAVVVEVAGCH